MADPKLKQCRACGACSEKMDKCQTCRDLFKMKWSAPWLLCCLCCFSLCHNLHFYPVLLSLFFLHSFGSTVVEAFFPFNLIREALPAERNVCNLGIIAASNAKFLIGRATKHSIKQKRKEETTKVVCTCGMHVAFRRCTRMKIFLASALSAEIETRPTAQQHSNKRSVLRTGESRL